MALEVFTAQNKYSFYFSDIWCAVGLAYNGKALLLPAPHFNFLVIALLSILFIGAIAFPNNITAFTLHSLPTFIACLFLAEGEQWLRMLYCLTLPIAGITLQNIIQKRSDAFTRG